MFSRCFTGLCFALLLLVGSNNLRSVASTTQQVVWSTDPATDASLQPQQNFGSYFIKLPKNYSLSTTRKFQEADQWQWHGELHDDGTRPVIEIWVVHLDADHASGDTTAYGE